MQLYRWKYPRHVSATLCQVTYMSYVHVHFRSQRLSQTEGCKDAGCNAHRLFNDLDGYKTFDLLVSSQAPSHQTIELHMLARSSSSHWPRWVFEKNTKVLSNLSWFAGLSYFVKSNILIPIIQQQFIFCSICSSQGSTWTQTLLCNNFHGRLMAYEEKHSSSIARTRFECGIFTPPVFYFQGLNTAPSFVSVRFQRYGLCWQGSADAIFMTFTPLQRSLRSPYLPVVNLYCHSNADI